MFILYANKTQLTVCSREPVASGGVNVYQVRFEFSEDWTGLSRTAIFRAGVESRAVLLKEDNETIIPWEVLQEHSIHLFCGVYGTQGEHTVLPTIWVDLGTIQPGVTLGEPAQPPTLNIWEQQLASKGDGLSYNGTNLTLMSGDKPLSTVEIKAGGDSGESSATFTPAVSADGVLSWTNDGGLPNPEPVDLKGPPGIPGTDGKNATINGENTLEIVAGENVSLKQEDGTLTISASGSSGTSQEVYSTEEIRIGTWIDGKPLYRQVLELIMPVKSGWSAVYPLIDGIDIKMFSAFLYYNVTEKFPMTAASGELTKIAYNTTTEMFGNVPPGLAVFNQNMSYCGMPFTVIMEYTKTAGKSVKIPVSALFSPDGLAETAQYIKSSEDEL